MLFVWELFFSSSEFCFETLLEKLGWDLASLYPAKLSKQRLQGLGFFPGSLDSCKLLELCSRCLSFHIHACFLCQHQLFRPQLPISASQIRAPPYLKREHKKASLEPRSRKGKRLSGKGHLVMLTFSRRVPPCSLTVTLMTRSQEFACV